MASADTVDAAFTGLTLAAAFSLASFYDRRNDDGARDAAYVCVECGHDLGAPLTRANKIGQITLTRCGRCRAVADKYVEHEHVAVALSLVLHRAPAYRHLLFNSRRWGGAAAPWRLAHCAAVAASWLAASLETDRALGPLLGACAAQHAALVATVVGLVPRADDERGATAEARAAAAAARARRVSVAVAVPCLGQLLIAVLAMFEEDPRAPALLIRLLTCTSQFQAVSAASRCARRPRAVALALCAGLACSFAVSCALAPGRRFVWPGWAQACLGFGLGAG